MQALLTWHSQRVHASRFHRAPSACASPSASVHPAALSRDSSFFICEATRARSLEVASPPSRPLPRGTQRRRRAFVKNRRSSRDCQRGPPGRRSSPFRRKGRCPGHRSPTQSPPQQGLSSRASRAGAGVGVPAPGASAAPPTSLQPPRKERSRRLPATTAREASQQPALRPRQRASGQTQAPHTRPASPDASGRTKGPQLEATCALPRDAVAPAHPAHRPTAPPKPARCPLPRVTARDCPPCACASARPGRSCPVPHPRHDPAGSPAT